MKIYYFFNNEFSFNLGQAINGEENFKSNFLGVERERERERERDW